jgi:tetratricopeptide (TPR) repeat protein
MDPSQGQRLHDLGGSPEAIADASRRRQAVMGGAEKVFSGATQSPRRISTGNAGYPGRPDDLHPNEEVWRRREQQQQGTLSSNDDEGDVEYYYSTYRGNSFEGGEKGVDEDDTDEGFLQGSDSHASTSWNQPGDLDNEDEDAGNARSRTMRRNRDRRKSVDLTTPTLIDEEDIYENEEEEQEMIRLERERVRKAAGLPPTQSFFGYEDDLRRTPGATMYRSSFEQESMRRTPGASKMHSSGVNAGGGSSSVQQDPVLVPAPDSSGLGFGLTLSPPIASSASDENDAGTSVSWGPRLSSATHNMNDVRRDETGELMSRSKGRVGTDSRRPFASPWTMGKGQQPQPQPESGRGVDSPNTLRLNKDIGNLLLEDDDASDETPKVGQSVFRNSPTSSKDADDDSSVTESRKKGDWTALYYVSMEAPSRVPRTYPGPGRGRKGRSDSTRRARVVVDRTPTPSSSSYASNHTFTQRPGGSFYLPHATAQPTPVRNFQPQPSGGHFGGSSTGAHSGGISEFAAVVDGVAFPMRAFENYMPQNPEISSSNRLFNLGGAFSPPTKGGSSIHAPAHQRQLPPAHSLVHHSNQGLFGRANGGFDGRDHLPPFPAGTPAFGAGFSNQQSLPQFQTTPSFGSLPNFQGQSSGPPSHPPHFGGPPSQNSVFSGSQLPPDRSRQSPTFAFQPQNMAYTIHPLPTMHQHHSHPPDFMSSMSIHHPHPLPPPPQFASSPQPWQHTMPYEGIPAQAVEAYGHPVHASHGGWHMGEYESYGLHHQQQEHHQPPAPAFSGYSSSPIPTPSPVWTPDGEVSQLSELQSSPFMVPPPSHQTCIPIPSTGRPPSRGKNQRKGASRKWVNWAPQHQLQKKSGLRPDATPSPATTITTTAGVGKKSVVSSKASKKKQPLQGKDRSTPPLHASDIPPSAVSEDLPERSLVIASTCDDPADTKRAELSESPATRTAFKDFYRKLRAEERESFQDAHEFAMQTLSAGSLPDSVHWRVYLELADLAKRSNRFEEARKLYHQVCSLQPYASQGWLEFSKLEEECGNMTISSRILHAGLEYCEYSENLLTRAIKHEEKMGNLSRARELLSRLKHVGIEKVWRTVLEGALLEARAGNDIMARRVLKYLMHHVPWYGPLYLEAYRLEKDLGHSKEALAVVERGLTAIPRYGPLWFGAFRLCEEIDLHDHFFWLPQSMAMIDRATLSISKELIWKVHLEAAQMLERSSTEYLDSKTDPTFLRVIESCRKRFSLTILSCPPNLRWKVWLAAGRMEVAAGNSDVARRLFLTAHRVVPDKGRAVALLECARLEEYVGDVELASAILCRSRNSGGSDWKVWLESVMLAIRSGDFTKAITLSQKALQLHSGTGRLWASLIQLRHIAEGEEAQFESLTLALNAVPKSGEVWCEGARIHLNPFSRTFDPQRASRHLFFATKFTPQYGDGFLESLRLLIIDQLLLPVAGLIWECTRDLLVFKSDDAWAEGLTEYVYSTIHELNVLYGVVSKEGPGTKNPAVVDSFLGTAVIEAILERLYSEQSHQFLDLTKLVLRCANADPNYGPLWFHCRSAHTDTARKVLTQAVDVMLNEVKRHANLYIAASVRRFAILALFQQNQENRWKEGSRMWESLTDQECLSSPSLQQIIEVGSNKKETGVELLESSIPPSDFITGIVALSRHRPLEEMTSSEKRKLLFGADSLFS